MYCKKCGTELRRDAVECNGCGTRVGKAVATTACPICGYAAMAPTKFCKNCGASLEEQLGRPGPAESSVSTPLPSARAAAVESTSQPIEEKSCPHCGAPIRAGAKFCKQCGKPPSEVMPRAAPSPQGAVQPRVVPLATGVSPPTVTARIHPPARVKRGTLVLVAGLSSLVVLGAAIGYVKIHKRAASKQANIERPSPVSSANAGAVQPASSGAAPPPNAPSEGQSVSQASQPTTAAPQAPMSSPAVGGPSPAPSKRKSSIVPTETPPPAPVPPPYQQAHENAEQALVAQRYIEPPDDSALSWARRARQQGDPGADQIDQQVLDNVMATVRAARATRNYDQATALLSKLGSLFPDRPELKQMSLDVRQEQQEYAKQLEREEQAKVIQAQTKQFPLRHRHLVGVQGFRPQYSYCEGFLKITPDGVAKFDCTRTEDPRGRCDHIVLNAGDIKEVRPNRDGSIRLVTTSSGNFDLYGDPSAVQGSMNALQTLVRR